MRVSIDLRYDSEITVSGLLIRERKFPAGELEEALAYIQKSVEKEQQRNLILHGDQPTEEDIEDKALDNARDRY